MSVKKNTTVQNKKKVLEALKKTLGIVTTACKKVGVSRTQFYIWYKEDERFRHDVDSVEGMALDFAESKLMENIGSKKETSIIFYLKTKGKKRGYYEKVLNENLNTHKGEIKTKIDYSKLDESTLKDIIKQLRDKRD